MKMLNNQHNFHDPDQCHEKNDHDPALSSTGHVFRSSLQQDVWLHCRFDGDDGDDDEDN